MNKIYKYFLFIILFWAVAFFAFFTYFYLSEIKKVNNLRLESESLNVNMGKRAIYQEFQAIMSDLLILSKHNAFHGNQMLFSIEAFRDVQNDFLLFSEMKGVYDQIRFLNTEGQEIIRVNYHQGNSIAVPLNLLQNKSDRYYFTESLLMDREIVYVSPLDLNMEHGEIEIPHKPMIRFGTPVFNKQGEKIGVLLLNYMADRLLENFSIAVANIGDHAAIMNSDGYWLKHPLPEMEWGFMLNEEHNITNKHPGSWRRIFPSEQGQFANDDGIFTFTTIHLFQTQHQSSLQRKVKKKHLAENEYQWKILSHVTPDVIDAENRAILIELVKIATPVFLLMVVLSWWLSQAIIKNKQVKKLLKQQATIDSLTGLPNRQLFQDRLSRALLHSKRLKVRFGLLFIDLDRFKIVNDTLGHAAGDQLLQEVSRRISQVVRETDTVARLGGDEFTVILNRISKDEDIAKIAQFIIETLSKPFVLNDQEVNIGASIGITIFPEDGLKETSLMNNADSAMYSAKQDGRNRYCFFSRVID